MSLKEVLDQLKSLGSLANVAGMTRFGIRTQQAFGVAAPDLRRLAREVGKDHRLALQLWDTGIHEARVLACLIDDPVRVTERQMERWATDFDNWAVCDACCGHLFDKTRWAYQKAVGWSSRREEYVKRAGFSLMAALAVHDKNTSDRHFTEFLSFVEREAPDERNFVRKAVNWALRQIGKRNRALNQEAIQTAKRIRGIDSKSARWIAADALRELTSQAVQRRLRS
jgi:3-methyladenine DNA glycosylase AlkD